MTLTSRALAAGFTGTTGVNFQVRIDNNPPTLGNEVLLTDQATQAINMFAVFQGLAAGTHTVSVFVKTFAGTAANVVLDPGNLGGRIVVKETI